MAFADIRNERIKKLTKLRESGIDPYPSHSTRTHTIQLFLNTHTILEKNNNQITLAGRVISIRTHGGSIFFDIYDGTARTQGYIKKDIAGKEAFSLFIETIDAGDFIEISGVAFTTKRGARSILVNSWRMLTKSLRPIPDAWFGIKDEEERYRKRYLDLILSDNMHERFNRRSLFWNTIRNYLLERDFIEVETPVLETTPGGGNAEPFRTHHNSLALDVYLRISAGELWQKRLLVAGFPKIFEIGRIFRNEGMSSEHLQDYTQVEFYEAFKDYEEGMDMIVDLYRTIAKKVYGTTTFTIKGNTVELGKKWELYSYSNLINKQFDIDPLSTTISQVHKTLTQNKILFEKKSCSLEKGIDLLWKHMRKTINGPGFLIDVPTYLEPLAKHNKKDPRIVDRFQVLISGSENGKGFSELNDPLDQAKRFAHQQALRDNGDFEAQRSDDSFIEALEYGMPPAFGFGASERLFSFFEDISIREGQFFPLLRPKTNKKNI